MKKLAYFLLAAVCLVSLVGCGDPSNSDPPALSPPVITSNQITQDAVNLYVDGTVGFTIGSAYLDTMTVTITNASGVVGDSKRSSLAIYSSLTSGTIPYIIDYLNYPAGTYTITVYLTDLNGYQSGPVYQTFTK